MALLFVQLGAKLYLVSAFLHYNVGDASCVRGCGVYKMDLARKRWRKVRNIGDRALLMCPQYFGGWCTETVSGLKPNCIYWMGLCDDNLLRIFDINGNGDTREVHDPCKDIPGSDRNAVWMLPTDP
ncbi:hypothetical protein ZWY2020_043615 [Hordeum vulgare]|nr:hypothetical protein ZWY2020_043615 [Hordeum vulgare]